MILKCIFNKVRKASFTISKLIIINCIKCFLRIAQTTIPIVNRKRIHLQNVTYEDLSDIFPKKFDFKSSKVKKYLYLLDNSAYMVSIYYKNAITKNYLTNKQVTCHFVEFLHDI